MAETGHQNGNSSTSPPEGIRSNVDKRYPPLYLSLQRVNFKELPKHPDIPDLKEGRRASLSQFLDAVLAEALEVDFEKGWSHQGTWHPAKGVLMPIGGHDGASNPVPISVEQRSKVMHKANWLARTSFHLESDVKYAELNELLSEDHSRKEAKYTPSVFDGTELLAWSKEDLAEAVSKMRKDFKVRKAQMSIYQMLHEMPAVGGFGLLNDRVFHLLVITVHNAYTPTPNPETTQDTSGLKETEQSITMQLPIDISSCSEIKSMVSRSHLKPAATGSRYQFPSDSPTASSTTAKQKKRIGKKITEGNYVSLERLRKAPKDPHGDDCPEFDVPLAESLYHHRWDMCTLSTAGGATNLAPKKVKDKEILKAIVEDVQYVLSEVADTRKKAG